MRNPFSPATPHEHKSDNNGIVGGIRILAIVTFVVAFFSAIAVSVTSFPFTEGWYETLIFLKKHGFQEYKNIEFVLPPITVVCYRMLDMLTGSNLALNKLFGVCLSVVDVAILYLWMRRFVSMTAATFGSVFVFVLMTAEPLYIPGDYHDIVQLFLTTSILLIVSPKLFSNVPLNSRQVGIVALAGLTSQVLLLTKQNVGLGVTVAVVLGFAVLALSGILERKMALIVKSVVFFGVYISAFAVTGFSLLRVLYPDQEFGKLYVSFFLVGSKGSPIYAATRLLHDTNNLDTIWPAFLIAAFICVIFFAIRYIRVRSSLPSDQAAVARIVYILGVRSDVVKSFFIAMLPIVIMIVALDAMITLPTIYLWDFWPCIFVFSCYFLDVFSIIAGLGEYARKNSEEKNNLTYDVVRVVVFGMVFLAHSMTAALNVVGLAMFFGYYMAIAMECALTNVTRFHRTWQQLSFVTLTMLALVYVGRLELSKFNTPYSWWGTEEPPVYGSSSKMTIPYLSGLRLSTDRAAMIHSIISSVQENSGPNDPILVYPDIPIFYMLANRLPMTKTYIQWFDFATNASLIPDFEGISTQPPKVIVEMSVPKSVYIGHESLLGRIVPQRAFSEYIQCMVENGALVELNQFFYNRSDALDGTYYFRTARAISAERVNEMAALAAHYPTASYVVTGALGLDDSVVTPSEMQKIADQKSNGFGGFVVKGNSDEVSNFLRYLSADSHLKMAASDDNFILRVLKRADGWSRLQQNCPLQLHQALRTISERDAED